MLTFYIFNYLCFQIMLLWEALIVCFSLLFGRGTCLVVYCIICSSLPSHYGCPGGIDAWESSELQRNIEICRNKTDICVTENGNILYIY